MSCLLASLVLAVGAGSWQAPQVDRIAPLGGQRGTEVTVEFQGQRLFEPQGLMLGEPGLEVLEVASDKPERCTVRLQIAEDCALGSHPLRLRTAFGIANLTMFQVGTLPEVVENRVGDAVQVVPLDCTVNGSLRAEELDRYAVELAAGTLVQCELQAFRLGAKAIDLAMLVLGPDGGEIARADDTVLGIKDPMLSFVASAAGSYEVRVQTAFTDDQNFGSYRLHLGTFPRPTGCVPCGGQPGEELEVTLLGMTASAADD
ncbi:MAG: PPC domain-containing protein, partial [Planctomycetota bacterium]